MERTELYLAPQWLTKGTGGGSRATHHSQSPIHQDESFDSFFSRQCSSAYNLDREREVRYKKAVADVSILPTPTAPPANIGTLTGIMQKAAFERNFPSLPTNMGPRDKIKAKVVRTVYNVAPQPIKLRQPLLLQLVNSPNQPPAPPRVRASQGKLLVRKSSKEVVSAVLSLSPSFQGDGGSSMSVVGAPSVVVGMGGSSPGTNGHSNTRAPGPRNQKQLLDRCTIPIPPISVAMGSGESRPHSKEGGSASEDKRPRRPVSNRRDFFNALRKKAAGTGIIPGIERKDPELHQRIEGVIEKAVEVGEKTSPFAGDVSQVSACLVKENGIANIQSLVQIVNSPVACTNQFTATEEEEVAFLRSLGWEESADESEEGLTEEEINSFYQERLCSITIPPSLPNAQNHQRKDVQGDLHVGSIGSVSSSMINSSDSESDEELPVRRRSYITSQTIMKLLACTLR